MLAALDCLERADPTSGMDIGPSTCIARAWHIIGGEGSGGGCVQASRRVQFRDG